MVNVLIISDNINNINHFRRFFGTEFKISATNSPGNAMNALQTRTADLVIYHAGMDYGGLFGFYKKLRQNAATGNLPLIIITDASFAYALEDKVELENAAVVGLDVPQEVLLRIAESLIQK